MELNWWLYFLTALMPLAVGAFYYSPKVAGKSWMETNNFTQADLEGGNMPMILGLTYLAGLFISVLLSMSVVHQMHLDSILMNEEGFGEAGSALTAYLDDFRTKYGDNFRTFKHGAFHGSFMGLLFVGSVITINALFERRGFKYILIHTVYWVITLALMGGILSAFL